MSGAIIPMSKVKPEIVQYLFYPAVSKWGYELVGGGICCINDNLTLSEPIKESSGNFNNHWWILFNFSLALYVLTLIALRHKDSQQV